jgi:hypothetical protein
MPLSAYTAVIKRKYPTYSTSRLFAHTVHSRLTLFYYNHRCTVQAVERMKQCLESRLAKESWDGTPALAVTSVALDWFLWTAGEKRRDDSSAHHKTLTVFY